MTVTALLYIGSISPVILGGIISTYIIGRYHKEWCNLSAAQLIAVSLV
jgi:hypothetical protein